MVSIRRGSSVAIVLVCIAGLAGTPLSAQVTPSDPPSSGAPVILSEARLEQLVGPIALYPDDLVAIILPASTYPLEIVQASRFLEKRKANKQLQPEAGWDDSVKSLLNYPDVVAKMNDDLDWSEALGEAVVADSSAVLEAVQAFRRRAQVAGHLKTDDKQTVVVEKEVITVVPADPQVIYVPRYEPTTVVVAGAAPYAYYPTPYPVYYYPYPPGAALATGLIWGAAIGAAWNGGRWNTNYGGGSINTANNITVNRGGNSVNAGGARAGQLPANSSAWKSNRQSGQVGRPATRPASGSRAGDAGAGFGGRADAGGGVGGRGDSPGASTRPAGAGASGTGGRGNLDRGGGQQASQRNGGGGGRGDGGAFGGMGSGGGGARQASARGMDSRASAGGGGRASAGGGGHASGGARASGGGRPAGGGGGRAGGGGGRGGGGRR